MSKEWENTYGVISGGTSGIGLATAKLLLSQGAKVLLLGRTDKNGDLALADLKEYAGRVKFLRVDLGLVSQCEQLGKVLAKQGDKLNFLVNSAGCYEEKPLQDITAEDYNFMLSNNLQSTIFLTKALLPLFKDGSAIVNIASDAGIRGNYGCPLYSAAKGGVVAFSRSLALDLAPRIRVNCICPGDVDTPLVDKQIARGGYTKAEMAQVYPMGRIGKPEEIAHVIGAVLSSANSFMTGAVIPVDGGLSANG
jgi:NAD(P)-dependent dehydrogenase (short-subunit alcohol dehydrogenase family)